MLTVIIAAHMVLECVFLPKVAPVVMQMMSSVFSRRYCRMRPSNK